MTTNDARDELYELFGQYPEDISDDLLEEYLEYMERD